ncbi:MAG: flippase [Acidobacteria bacterium]|nr:flippase [Acidobacteriota bacterium]
MTAAVETLRRRSFLVSGGYATISAGSAGLLLVLLTLAGRWLTSADYGRFRYALALTMIVETVMDLGLGQVTVRAVARDRAGAGRLLRQVFGLKLVWVAIGLLLLAIVAPVLRSDPALVRLCYVMGLSSALRSYLLTGRGVLQGMDRFDLEAVLVVSDRALLLATGALALWLGDGAMALALAFVASRAVMLVASLALLRGAVGPVSPLFDRASWRELQAAAIPLGFFMIALNLYTYVDTVILGVMRTDVETGWYAASYSVYEGITYAPAIMSAVLTPRLSSLFTTDRRAHRLLLRRSLLSAAALGVALGGVTALGARPLMLLLFGDRYAAAIAPLRILSGGALFVFCTWILHAAAISTNLDRRLLATTIAGLSSNVILNLLFIPRWGISGAAWATVIAEALTSALLLVQILRRLREP